MALITILQVQRQKAFVQRCRDQVMERVKELEEIKAAAELERKKVIIQAWRGSLSPFYLNP